MAVMQVVGLFHQRLLLQGWRGWGSREEICSGREVRGAGWSPPTDRVVSCDFRLWRAKGRESRKIRIRRNGEREECLSLPLRAILE